MNNKQIILTSPRLILRLPIDSDGPKFQAFEERNLKSLSPWRSSHVEQNFDHEAQIKKWQEEFLENKSIRFLLFLRDQPEDEILGFCNFSQIFRGPFQACYLGYQMDSAHQGKGLMSEAVAEAVRYMFEVQNIHRVMANYMPSNPRSAALLKNQGFVIEGRAEKYLLINGKWEDHVLTSLTNQNWILPLS